MFLVLQGGRYIQTQEVTSCHIIWFKYVAAQRPNSNTHPSLLILNTPSMMVLCDLILQKWCLLYRTATLTWLMHIPLWWLQTLRFVYILKKNATTFLYKMLVYYEKWVVQIDSFLKIVLLFLHGLQLPTLVYIQGEAFGISSKSICTQTFINTGNCISTNSLS